MTLTIADEDVTDRLIDSGTEVSADINEVFGMLAKAKEYRLRDYDDYFNPFAAEGLFSQINFRGQTVIEKDDYGITTFYGTIQNIEMTDDQECIVYASEPMTIFLDWPVDASDRTTYAGYLVNGAVSSGQSVTVDTGTLSIPVGSVVYFNGSKVPSYMVTAKSPSSGATTSITIDRPVEVAIADNSPMTVAVPATTTGPQALKDALSTSNPDILLDGTFDILAASDLAAGRTIIVNVMEQDNVSLRDHVSTIREMTDLILTQKNDGYYTIRRGLEWDFQSINDELTADELCGPIEPVFDDSALVIGFDLIYKSSTNTAALLQADVDQALVTKYRGIKFWQSNKTAQSFAQIKYMYASVGSAQYFGQRRLAYCQKPRTVINCRCKPSYADEPLRATDIYLGKQVRATVRTFDSVPAIVVGYIYDESSLQYTKLKLQLNEEGAPPVVSVRITTDSEYRITTDGFYRGVA